MKFHLICYNIIFFDPSFYMILNFRSFIKDWVSVCSFEKDPSISFFFFCENSFKICDFRFRRSNAGYEEFETPREGSKDNKGFEDEREYSRQASFESLPEPERPPLRHIDTYCKPECPCLSKRYTIATLACIGKFLNTLSHLSLFFI